MLPNKSITTTEPSGFLSVILKNGPSSSRLSVAGAGAASLPLVSSVGNTGGATSKGSSGCSIGSTVVSTAMSSNSGCVTGVTGASSC